ncbi:MAG: stalk domain-containing protein [Caldisericia bacterium]|nr:stalk domain-containing protein [Caldisericia bacterium]
MIKRKTNSVLVYLLFFCMILPFCFHEDSDAVSPVLRFDPATVSITMRTNQKKEENVQLINDSTSLIHFSLYKSAEQKTNLHSNPEISLFTEEFGSSWATYKCNFQRQGFNPVESAIPPYALKWTYQGNRPLLSPVLSGDSLLIPSVDGTIYVIDARTGIYRSRISLDYPIVSLHLQGAYLAIITTNEIVLYNRSSHVFLWRKPFFTSNLASVIIQEKTIYFLTGTYLISANIATGNENWKIANQDNQLLFADNLVVSSNETRMIAFEASTGKIAWTNEGITLLDLPAEMNKQVFIIQREGEQAFLTALQINGSQIWKQPIFYPDVNYIAVHTSYVVVTTISGNVICFDRITGKEVWTYKNQSKVHIPPVIATNHVYIGSNIGRLFALSLETGSLVWQTNTQFPIYNPLVIAKGFVYITDALQNLYAYGREWENVVPPEPPDQVKAIPGDKMVTLFWRHAKQTPDFAGYHIYRKPADEIDFSFIASIGIVNQFQDYALKNNQSYHYLVRSYDTFGNESTNSNMISVKPEESGNPIWLSFDPTGGTVNPSRASTIRLQLSTRDLLPGEYLGFLQCLYTDENLETDYVALPISLHVLEENEKLLPLPKISAIEASDTRVLLKWESNENVKEYLVYRSIVKNDELKLIATLPPTIFFYQDDTVVNHKTYYYYIQYKTDTDQVSDFSVEATIIPEPLLIKITYPTTALLYEPVFNVLGQADPKAKVFYQNYPVQVEADGYFSIAVGINLGKNRLVFIAIDTEGKAQQTTLEVEFITSTLKIELTIGSSIVLVNDKTWPFRLEAPPVIRDNRTFVPLRFISEVVGAQVEWVAKEQRIDIIKESNHIVLWIGKKQAKLNNTLIELESAPFLENNRTMIPLRFITEPLGAKIQWDPIKQTIQLFFKS